MSKTHHILDLRVPIGLLGELIQGAKSTNRTVKGYTLHLLAEASKAKQDK